MSEHPLLRADSILGALVDAGVDFVVIGGLAAQVHGSPSLTGDVGICHSLDRANLDRLELALGHLSAIRRNLPDAVRAPVDAHALRAGDVFTLTTRDGDLDLLAHPDPGLDFETLARSASTVEILGVPVRVASLDDLMAMKRAAGRPKDRVDLEILGALREEIDRRPA
ncbi:MAG: nucleotidyltransferase [Chloroflexota bacterium]|nr:nucleotidyltransferase [Chloroflexota bacterium]